MSRADREELWRMRAGDRGSFERFIQRWDTEVLNLAYRLTGHAEDAKDVRQNAFLRMYTRLETFKGDARLSSWLFRVVVNLCRDHQRTQAVRNKTLRTSGEMGWKPKAEDHAGRTVEQNDVGKVVAEALESLPQTEREVVVLKHYHHFAIAQIAEVLDMPHSTVRSRLSRAMRRLRDHLSRSPVCTKP